MGKEIIRTLKFRGLDDWNRPVYKQEDAKVYIGSTSVLFPNKEIAPNGTTAEINAYFRANLDKLEYFGTSFNCEPDGRQFAEHVKLEIND
jgi:hypothetical protein